MDGGPYVSHKSVCGLGVQLEMVSTWLSQSRANRWPLLGVALVVAVAFTALYTSPIDEAGSTAPTNRHLLAIPTDVFSLTQLKDGAVLLHVLCGLVVFCLLGMLILSDFCVFAHALQSMQR